MRPTSRTAPPCAPLAFDELLARLINEKNRAEQSEVERLRAENAELRDQLASRPGPAPPLRLIEPPPAAPSPVAPAEAENARPLTAAENMARVNSIRPPRHYLKTPEDEQIAYWGSRFY